MPSPSTPPAVCCLATGNKGNIYRVESPSLYTALLTMPATQITAFQAGRDGHLYAATGNVGKVYEIGPGLEQARPIESDVFDAVHFTLWGRLSFEANLNGGTRGHSRRAAATSTSRRRTGAPGRRRLPRPKGGRIASPRGAFRAMEGARSPRIGRHNRRSWNRWTWPTCPRMWRRASTRSRSPRPITSSRRPPLRCLRPRRQPFAAAARPQYAAASPLFPSNSSTITPAMQYAKGYVGARWLASDPNGDALIYTVEIRGVNETALEAAEGQNRGEIFLLRLHCFPRWRIPPACHRLRFAPGNPPAEALSRQPGERPLLHRQYAAAHHRPDRRPQRRQDARPLARRRRTEQRHQGRVLARWRRLVHGGPVTRLSDSPTWITI